MKSKLPQIAAHMLFRGREFHTRHLSPLAEGLRNEKILELGSGKPVDGKYPYSMRHLFHVSNEFIQSDIDPSFGHPVVDVTTMDYDEEFDVVLCLNVMEHVYDFHRAFDNVYRAVKSGGGAIIAVPGYYPLHDEPHDYWRYTEHSLRRLLSPFRAVELTHSGLRQYPFAYFIHATK